MHKDKSCVSIIVPVYNTEKYLRRCIDSLLIQTYTELEIIMIDDGSTDGSLRICNEYAIQDKRIVVIHKKNGGVSSARNIGLDVSTGKYIVFLDSDDFEDSHFIETEVRMLEDEQADLVICGFSIETEKDIFIPYYKDQVVKSFSRQEALSNLLENKYYTCSLADKMCRRELIGSLRFDEKISHYEDLLFLYKLIKKCKKIIFDTHYYYYYYCQNQGSAANSPFHHGKMSMVDVWDYIYKDVHYEERWLLPVAKKEFVRNNLMVASLMIASGYDNPDDINRVRGNVRELLFSFMLSNAACGYKLQAVVIVINWKLFKGICRR